MGGFMQNVVYAVDFHEIHNIAAVPVNFLWDLLDLNNVFANKKGVSASAQAPDTKQTISFGLGPLPTVVGPMTTLAAGMADQLRGGHR